MNDKELLELAARAIGINLWWDGESPKELVHRWSGNPEDGGEERDYPWNPLTDDRDALRLAAMLGLGVRYIDDKDRKMAVVDYEIGSMREDADANIFSATRRAIVRAAAEIGRRM